MSLNLLVSQSLWSVFPFLVSYVSVSLVSLGLMVSPMFRKAGEAFPDHLVSMRPPCVVFVRVVLMYLLASPRKEGAMLVASRARTINM